MKRSKSGLSQKSKKSIKSPIINPKKKKLKLSQINQPITFDNNIITQRAQTSRNNFQERLSKIRQGFVELQKNFDNSNFIQISKPLAPITSELIAKTRKKLFTNQTAKRTTSNTKVNDKSTAKKVKQHKIGSPYTPTNKNYHTCLYQKSLFDLMKIVVMQKSEINRLNHQINNNKSKK